MHVVQDNTSWRKMKLKVLDKIEGFFVGKRINLVVWILLNRTESLSSAQLIRARVGHECICSWVQILPVEPKKKKKKHQN